MNTLRKISVQAENWPIAGNFVISRGAKTIAEVIKVTVSDGKVCGHGECVPYARYDESVDSVIKQIQKVSISAEKSARQQLMRALPAGAARNALDCALWDLEAKLSGAPAWELAGLKPLEPATTAFTISLGTADKMAADCHNASERSVLKVKLGGEGDIERMKAIRSAAPNATLILDANESWDDSNFLEHMQVAAEINADLIEQPLPSNNDQMLENVKRLVPVCADESLHTRHELPALKLRYDCINVKLDKAGGLTEALELKNAAQEQGFMIMVGCMVSTSLSMAPAMLVAQNADFVDLDGPLLLAKDRDPAMQYSGSTIFPPSQSLWG